MSKDDALEELYIEQLRELYSAEIQQIDALPEMMRTAHNPKLKVLFDRHLKQTYLHVERIEQLLEDLEQSPTGHTCDAVHEMVKEGRQSVRDEPLAGARDAALIRMAQRIGHYEIASYGCVRIYASLRGDEEAADLLQTTLNEEAETEQGLTRLAGKVSVDYRTGSVSSHR